jgi:glutamyl-tRNA synthetase
MSSTPRLRFAPSPTGPLHIGGARTAIYNWAAARAMGGTFLLRIEDTDRERSTAESLQIILEGLGWLGVQWDEGPDVGGPFGPYFQTERLPIYARYAERLLASGAAYRCVCTPEEVEAGRKALEAKGLRPMYDRRCRDRNIPADRPAAVRFRMPLTGSEVMHDLCKGDVEVQLAELDDWVMVRPDGMPTYNFACVVDDLEMRITHVVRGDEHFLNGIKQLALYRALDATPPRFAHIPLILGKDGRKLSKRDATTNLLDYRDLGYPPDALFNYISLLGWGFSGDRDVFTRAEMIERFRIEDIGTGGAHFDEDKLRALCGHYVRGASIADLVAAVRPFLLRAGAVPEAAFATHPRWLENVVACYQERIQLYSELPDKVRWFFGEHVEPDAAAAKNLANPESRAWLRAYADRLAAQNLPPSYPQSRGAADDAVRLPSGKGAPPPAGPFTAPAQLEADARALAEELGVKFGQLVHPVRAALTGTDKGPGLFDVVYLLGKERCVARLRAAANRT